MQAHHRVIALGTGYAKSRQEAERSSISVQHVTYMLKQYFGVQFPYRDHQAKVVVPQIPRKAVTMFSVFGKPRPNPGQHLVPCFKPIPFVKELELFQIDDDHHPLDSSFLQQLFRSVKEIAICRKACQGIQHDLLFPVDLCFARFPVLDLLNIKNITVKNTIRQAENGAANYNRIHPFPLVFQVLDPELELQGSRQVRLFQPVPQCAGIHDFCITGAVLRVHQIFGSLFIKAVVHALGDGRKVLLFNIIDKPVTVVIQVDFNQFVIRRMFQEFRNGIKQVSIDKKTEYTFRLHKNTSFSKE